MFTPRMRRFLEEYRRNGGNVFRAGVYAGYSENYVKGRGKILLQNAIKAQSLTIAREVQGQNISMEDTKKMMFEIVGFTREELLSNIKEMATQTKDYATRLKVVKALAKELGVSLDLAEDENKNAPVLNIVVEKKEAPLILEAKESQ